MSNTNVRKLLSKAKQNRSSTAKIEHPLAKYDTLGRLTCILCNSTVKSERGWPVHLSSKIHKENLDRVKALPKVNSGKNISNNRNQSNAQPSLVAHEDLSEEESAEDIVEPKSKKFKADADSSSVQEEHTPNHEESSLPPGFFDEPSEEPVSPSEQPSQVNEESTETPESALPAGFFDNKEEELKTLGPSAPTKKEKSLEKEWEIFQEEINKETQRSEKIFEQEEIETALDRDEEERRTQESLLNRVNLLRMKAAENRRIIGEPVVTNMSEDEKESTDDSEYEDLLDWRTKRVV
ncbi:26S proteasome non-ATPase regulatory subunit 5 [Basidiobolus ranarum]|uniref:Zinc finger protein 830 n=1 Tax=Basidiobolus ranarum TaxID=34480 RepID=A0ABR2W8S7_9FUNG